MGARILVVEDTPHNLQLMTYLLAAYDHTVATAGTGEQAIELASAAPPDLIVMDLQLPGIDGYQALKTLRSVPELSSILVVAVTSFAMVGDRDRALEAGFDHYMTKPIDPETFVEEIHTRLPERLRGSPPVRGGVQAAHVTEPSEPAPHRRGAADVLVLDDSLVNQTLVRSVLEPYGYRVRTTFTVEAAIAAADEKCPDVVLSDLHVGHQRGTELLAHMRAVPTLSVVPFAFLTATADRLDPMLRDGTVRLIRRPIDPVALLDEVRVLLESRTGR
jgi:two-component system cell cycle response regulator